LPSELILRFIILLTFLVLVPLSHARTLNVIVGWDKPPYVVSSSHSGIELELIGAVLHDMGHEILPIYVPFGRTVRLIEQGVADIGLTVNEKHDIDKSVLSNPYIIYQNVAVTLAESMFTINSVDDLQDKSVVAFQTASTVLGDTFHTLMAGRSRYIEMPEQERQVSMLLLGSVDAVIMDRNIFTYLKSAMPKPHRRDTVIHEIFPVSLYSAAIPNAALRRDFNLALADFIEDGRYDALLKKYGLDNQLSYLQAASIAADKQ
jgi:polar amino acid transport system substrate-binding protein